MEGTLFPPLSARSLRGTRGHADPTSAPPSPPSTDSGLSATCASARRRAPCRALSPAHRWLVPALTSLLSWTGRCSQIILQELPASAFPSHSHFSIFLPTPTLLRSGLLSFSLSPSPLDFTPFLPRRLSRFPRLHCLSRSTFLHHPPSFQRTPGFPI